MVDRREGRHLPLGRRGGYTRARGLDRETQKELLVRHIKESEPEGAPLRDLQQVLKELSRKQVQTLLRELREERRVIVTGVTRAGRWHIAHKPSIAPSTEQWSNPEQSGSKATS
jgi:ATP-dependent DNA helicase RecG